MSKQQQVQLRTQPLALVILFGVAGIANAAGLRDYNDDTLPASRDGNNLTVDDNTGLEWLDIDVFRYLCRTCYGLDDASTAPGFTIATTPQVNSLFDALGFTDDSIPSTAIIVQDDYAEYGFPDFSVWEAAAAHVGVSTLLREEGRTQQPMMAGWATHPNPEAPPSNYVPYVQLGFNYETQINDEIHVGGNPHGNGWQPSEETGRKDVGFWLVRTHVIPEPSTFSMLAFCCIAMVGYSRLRRRSRSIS